MSDVNWDILHSKRDRQSWIWKHGCEIMFTETGAKYWVCMVGHKEGDFKKYSAASTHNAIKHLDKAHQIVDEAASPAR
jgi:hypothetical protein